MYISSAQQSKEIVWHAVGVVEKILTGIELAHTLLDSLKTETIFIVSETGSTYKYTMF